jgi:hypothetical protein
MMSMPSRLKGTLFIPRFTTEGDYSQQKRIYGANERHRGMRIVKRKAPPWPRGYCPIAIVAFCAFPSRGSQEV